MPTLLELDGIRHLAEGSYKIGFGEIALGAYKNTSDYYAIKSIVHHHQMLKYVLIMIWISSIGIIIWLIIFLSFDNL